MQDALTVIQTVGFPIAVAIACGLFIYKMINRDKDEALAREKRQAEQQAKLSDALNKAADVIDESTKVNKDLSETNRLMATDIKVSLEKILYKVSK